MLQLSLQQKVASVSWRLHFAHSQEVQNTLWGTGVLLLSPVSVRSVSQKQGEEVESVPRCCFRKPPGARNDCCCFEGLDRGAAEHGDWTLVGGGLQPQGSQRRNFSVEGNHSPCTPPGAVDPGGSLLEGALKTQVYSPGIL